MLHNVGRYLTVLMWLVLISHSNLAIAQQDDDYRRADVKQIISALESYALENDSYRIYGTGHNGNGNGWFHFEGGVYDQSISRSLLDLGHLQLPLPKDPQHQSISQFSTYDYMVYHCKDRVAVFSKSNTIAASANDSSWWVTNNCTRIPIDVHDHPFFVVSKPLFQLQQEGDTERISGINRIITALESYAANEGTYRVLNSGHKGNGNGWFHREGPFYSNSIANTLVQLGHLIAPAPSDPLHNMLGEYSTYDYLVYQCLDRVAVFSKGSSITPSSDHANWWSANNCTRIPIDIHGHSYFELSRPLSSTQPDVSRTVEVSRVVTALEDYARTHSTFRVADAGHKGRGNGWFHYSRGLYPESISNALEALGNLSSPLPKDPLHITPGELSPYDFLVYQCKDRVAVFSKANNIVPSEDDRIWWSNNNCTRIPLDVHGHQYYLLSKSLAELLPEPNIPAPNLADYHLVFEDNFDGDSLDYSKWDTALLWGPYFPINNEEQLYVDSLGMHADFGHSPFEFTGTTLKITAVPTSNTMSPPPRPPRESSVWQPRTYSEYRYNGPTADGPGYQPSDVNYLSGIITTYESLKMTYGYVEMRAKLPAGRGLWPAFWLLPTHYVETVPEIDVMEFLGQYPDSLFHTYHYFDIKDNWRKISTPSYRTYAEDWTQSFHTFGMAWGPKEIIFYVNGVETRRITDQEYLIPGQAMYLIANLAIGGNWAGPPDSTTPFPASFEIDYIRAYERKLQPALNLAADYQLMFEDDFNGTTLDPNKWNTSFLWGPYLDINNEEQYYVDTLGADRATNTNTPFVIKNGILSITARESTDPESFPIPATLPGPNASIWTNYPTYQQNTSYSPGNYTSGIITSYDSFKFVYGYAEIRARIPKGQGLWPAFWLLNGYYVGQQPEIDVLEVLGQNPHQTYHTFHRLTQEGVLESDQGTTDNGDPTLGYADSFHTYGVRWHRGKIDWFIDGRIVHSYRGDDVPYQLMYVIVNLAVGGNWPGSPNSETVFPATFDIDYIKVYQEKNKDNLNTPSAAN